VLSHPCALYGFVGQNERAFFERSLSAVGVDAQLTEVEGETRENITLIDPEAGQPVDTHIKMEGFRVARNQLQTLTERLQAACHGRTLVIFAGSLPPGLGPADLGQLIRACNECGAVALDTGGEVLAELEAEALWAVKPNRDELEAFVGAELGNDAAIRQAAVALTDRVEHVLVSLGAAGALLATRQRVWRATVEWDPGNVLNTVGCGDAFLAGFIGGILEQQGDASAAIKTAVAVATESSAHAGPAEFDLAAARALAERVTVDEI
jgi:1-phosphofructokinase family hexose kinase